MNETFGYSILDLTNPVEPDRAPVRRLPHRTRATRTRTRSSSTGTARARSRRSASRRTASARRSPSTAPSTRRGTRSRARNYGGEGFGLWGDFAPNRALGTVVQHVNGRYIAYAIHGSINMTAADITTLPSTLASYTSCTPGRAVRRTTRRASRRRTRRRSFSRGTTSSTRRARTRTRPSRSSTPRTRGPRAASRRRTSRSRSRTSVRAIPPATPMNFTAALDPGDSTKLWILVEVARRERREVAELRSRRGHEGRQRQPHRDRVPGPLTRSRWRAARPGGQRGTARRSSR